MDRRLTKTSKIIQDQDNSLTYNINSGSYFCVENDKSIRSFSNPGKKICEKITQEQENRLYIIESMALLNSLPVRERNLLYDFFIAGLSISVLTKKYKDKDIKGSIYLALLDLAVQDPLNNFTLNDRIAFDEKYKAYQKKIDLVIQDINHLKNRILAGQYHDYLKKMPSISQDYSNDYFFKAHPGRSRHDYKMRSILALALYYIHHPQLPADDIDQLLSNFGFGHRFIKKVKAFIDRGGFDHES
jgi:hypothetical protein